MIPRRPLPTIEAALAEAPAVALLGPRQAGKTTLAREVARHRQSVYLDLESEADRAKLAEPQLYLAQHANKLAILDRLLHHSQVITIRGDSYRLRDKRRSGLLQKAAAPTPITSDS